VDPYVVRAPQRGSGLKRIVLIGPQSEPSSENGTGSKNFMSTHKLAKVLDAALHGIVKHILLALVITTGFLYPLQAGVTKAFYDSKVNIHAESTTADSALIATPILKIAVEEKPVVPAQAAKKVTPIKKVLVNGFRTHLARISAYTSSVEETDDTPFITASGTRTRDGVVASNFLPIGTRIKIPALSGDKIYFVEDRMHPRFTNGVDIWTETKAEAFRIGVRNLEIVILD
jgi:3D (Asp-Asp-Asp) domain-containing protein